MCGSSHYIFLTAGRRTVQYTPALTPWKWLNVRPPTPHGRCESPSVAQNVPCRFTKYWLPSALVASSKLSLCEKNTGLWTLQKGRQISLCTLLLHVRVYLLWTPLSR